MKRIVTIQDISCVGKCSLTVALPIISAMGVETAIIPTAVLSTHTMFSGFTVKDLTDQIEPITAHWQNEKIDFDALYTGYLGSFEQIDLMKRAISFNLPKEIKKVGKNPHFKPYKNFAYENTSRLWDYHHKDIGRELGL